MRATFRSAAQQALKPAISEANAIALNDSAMIFAPHPDDETLACGGTIIKKRQAGADVWIVFMTDGRHSHSAFLPSEQLAELRRQEALSAAGVLGVDESHVFFLGVEDGQLDECQESARAQVLELLVRFTPQEVFIPYRLEPPADHVVTNQIVRSALIQTGLSVEIYEYPIWFWSHWPWMDFPDGGRRQNLRYLQNSFWFGLDRRVSRDFRHFVDVAGVLDKKQLALEQHQTQMRRFTNDDRWPTLADVSNGELLSLCLGPRELFALSQPL